MIGPLRHKLERMTLSRIPDTGGGAASLWQVAGEIWARVDYLTPIRDLTGDRRVYLKRIAAEIRPHSTFCEGDRVRHADREFEIVSIETVDDRQRRMILIGEEVTGS